MVFHWTRAFGPCNLVTAFVPPLCRTLIVAWSAPLLRLSAYNNSCTAEKKQLKNKTENIQYMLKSFASFTRMFFFKFIATDTVFAFHCSLFLYFSLSLSSSPVRLQHFDWSIEDRVRIGHSFRHFGHSFRHFLHFGLDACFVRWSRGAWHVGKSYGWKLLWGDRPDTLICNLGTHTPRTLSVWHLRRRVRKTANPFESFSSLSSNLQIKQVKQVQEVKQVREVKQGRKVKQVKEGKQVQIKVAWKKYKWKPRGRSETSKRIEISETRPRKSQIKVKWKKRK